MIERLYKKFNKNFESFELIAPSPDINEIRQFCKEIKLPPFEKTQYGYIVMPDVAAGAGPIYFSLIHKKVK